MRLLVCFLFTFSFAIWAQSPRPQKLTKSEQEEANKYLATAKAIEIEKQLSESELLKECKTKPNATLEEIQSCVQQKINDPSFNVDEFANKTNLKSFDLDASKDATSIRKYLSERLNRALYGEPDPKKMRKLVNHDVYNALYRSQIGKNILMEVSNYCLSHFGVKDNPNVLVNHCMMDSDNKIDPNCANYTKKNKAGNDISLNQKFIEFKPTVDANNPDLVTFDPTNFENPATNYTNKKNFWNNAGEHELHEGCKDKTSSGQCGKKVLKADNSTITITTRNTSLINAMKEFEFQMGPDYMRSKYQFCAFEVVQNMCEVYRCQHVYDNTSDKEKIKFCQDELGITINAPRAANYIPPTDPGTHGLMACSLVAKLKDYRNTIAALDELDAKNKENITNKGFDRTTYGGGFYSHGNANDEKSVEEITTIASSEFADEKLSLGLTAEEIETLNQECFDGNGKLSEEEKCQRLVGDIGEEGKANITAEMEAETQLYLKRVAELQDEESIKQYLIKHGLSRYIDKVAEDPDLLKRLIADEYKSERAALKKSMMEKFNTLTKKDPKATPGPDDIDANKVATDNIADLEKQKERIQTLFQYNNVISSYMQAQIGDDKENKTELAFQRDIELKGLSQANNEKAQEYEQLFQNDRSGSSKGNEQMAVDLNFIDGLLGNSKPEEQTP